MIIKTVGAAFILLACGYVGFHKAHLHRLKEDALEQLTLALEYMERELEYCLLPLPELCRRAGMQCSGAMRAVFARLAMEMDKQITADVKYCMDAALQAFPGLPQIAAEKLRILGRGMGKFDVAGQLGGIRSVKLQVKRDLDGLYAGHEERTRSYRTLGLCAGTALVILFI